MAGNKSNFLENAVLNHILGNTAYTAPATVYLGLWTATLSDTSAGNTAGEVSTASGSNYARKAITNNTSEWPTTSNGTKSNGNAQTFNTAGGTGWGTVTDFAILDSGTVGAGNILFYAQLNNSKVVSNGDTATFAASQITITED